MIKYPTELMEDVDIGVDSGQAGFYDAEYFYKTRNNDKWYDEVCDLTVQSIENKDYMNCMEWVDRFHPEYQKLLYSKVLTIDKLMEEYKNSKHRILFFEKLSAGIKDEKCCISSSGFGDGSYRLYIAKNANDKIIAAKIVFIDLETLDDEEIGD